VARRLTGRFYGGTAVTVAPELLGHVLVRTMPDGARLRARIVEVEAYEPHDAASHAFGGPTARNAVMFGPPGRLYVYRIYGMHHCMNVVTGPPGRGSAVLLRAGEPLEGFEAMAERRGPVGVRDLCRGPGRWTQAFDAASLDGADLVAGSEIWIERGRPVGTSLATVRIGVTKDAHRRWRFVEADSRWASGARRLSVSPSERDRLPRSG
jgi:DNA-3-methyladenine glycosylase